MKLTGKNNFAIKKLLAADNLTSDYLFYDPLAYENDGIQINKERCKP